MPLAPSPLPGSANELDGSLLRCPADNLAIAVLRDGRQRNPAGFSPTSNNTCKQSNTWRFAGFGKYTRFPYLFPAMQNSAVWLLSEEILWLLEGHVPNPLAIPWMTAQVSKLGFDADQAFQIVMLGKPHDAGARKKYFDSVDRFADLMPFGK